MLLEEGRLKKKGVDGDVAQIASHNVNRTLWILRNKTGLSYMQALEALENRQVEKRSKKKIIFFWQLEKYGTELQYDEKYTDTILLKETLKNYMVKSNTKRQSYLWIARQSKRVGLKPRELLGLIEQYKYNIDCNKIESENKGDDTVICSIREKKQRVYNVNLVNELQSYLSRYKGNSIFIYGGPMLINILTYKHLYTLISTLYGRPIDGILATLYKEYAESGEVYYKHDILQEYIRRVHAE
jgi:hypothetical protein